MVKPQVRILDQQVYCWGSGTAGGIQLPLSSEDVGFLAEIKRLDESRLSRDFFVESASSGIERLLTAAFKLGLEEGQSRVKEKSEKS